MLQKCLTLCLCILLAVMAIPTRPAHAATPRVVIFIPGFAGSELLNDAGELVWPNPNATGQLAGTEYLQPGSPLGWSTAVSSQPEYSQYGDLQDALTANGYTVVPFTYDWRQSLKEVMGEFDRFVEDVRWEQDVATVDIVADSTGGLIAKRYILDHKSVHPIRRLISIGTPYFGSPTAVAQLEGGMDKFGMHLDPTLLQSWPGFYDFLPLRT